MNIDGSSNRPTAMITPLNGTTATTILSSPVKQATSQIVDSMVIYNKDTASVTITVATYDGTTERILLKHQLLTTETLCWTSTLGWFII